MNKLHALFSQFFKFAIVGILTFCIDYALMIVLTERFHIYYLVSSLISFIVSIIFNYIVSMKYVFKPKENISKTHQFIVFLLLSAIGLGLNQFVLCILVNIRHLFYMIAKILATFIVTGWNFFSRKIFLEGKSSTQSA